MSCIHTGRRYTDMKMLTLFLSCLASAQSFEVASVKAVAIDSSAYKPAAANRAMTLNATGIGYNSVTLKDCILAAYQVKGYQVAGPGWIESDSQLYDISAKTAGPASEEQVRVMLQALLAERFKLTLHRERKELPVYALVVGKNGPKFHEAEAGSVAAPAKLDFKTGAMFFQATTMAGFADYLSRHGAVTRGVLDMTGLKGAYDITLRMFENPGAMSPADMKMSIRDWRDSSAIFTQVQEQLGLKLDAQKAPVEVLVVDRAEKIPTAN
jgi:uncharacterized protein (TIGR03435 family)